MRADHPWTRAPRGGNAPPSEAADPASPGDEAPAADAAAAPGAGQLARYQQLIAERELAGGPYASNLDEPLLSLARALEARGDRAGALGAYQRSLHIMRVNDGLYSARQGPVVRAILELYRTTGDYEALDGQYDYFFRLYGNGRPPLDRIRVAAAVEYLRWQREALRLDVGGSDERRLLDLVELNDEILELAADDPGLSIDDRELLVYSQLQNLYLVSDRISPRVDPWGMPQPTRMRGDPFAEVDITRERLEKIQRNSLARGRDLIEDFIGVLPPSDHGRRARAQLTLGDWYQWHNREREALESYAAARQALERGGLEDELASWWAEPVELPDMPAFWLPFDREASAVVTAAFDVSASGDARSVEVQAEEDQEGFAFRLRRELYRMRFRPRLDAGKAVAVQGLERQYRVLPR